MVETGPTLLLQRDGDGEGAGVLRDRQLGDVQGRQREVAGGLFSDCGRAGVGRNLERLLSGGGSRGGWSDVREHGGGVRNQCAAELVPGVPGAAADAEGAEVRELQPLGQIQNYYAPLSPRQVAPPSAPALWSRQLPLVMYIKA